MSYVHTPNVPTSMERFTLQELRAEFDKIEAAMGGGGSGVTSVSGTAPVVSSGGATPAISMPAATAGVSGYLTSSDWTTFNGKQAAGAYLTGNQTITFSGGATGTGATAVTLTLSNTAVTGQAITGYVSGSGVVAATDTILQAINKLDGNVALRAPIASPTFTGTVGGITAAMVGAPSGSGTSSGSNTGDNAINTLYSGLVSNATHTGDATGSTALTVVRINGTSLAGLATGLLKNTTGTGVPSIAVSGTDFIAPGGTGLTGTQVTNALGYTPGSAAGLSAFVIATNTAASAGGAYVMTASLTLTLPASPVAGNTVTFSNRSATTTCVVARNGQNIMGLAEDMTVNLSNAGYRLMFADATRGWVLI